jgi:hypothetical protein
MHPHQRDTQHQQHEANGSATACAPLRELETPLFVAPAEEEQGLAARRAASSTGRVGAEVAATHARRVPRTLHTIPGAAQASRGSTTIVTYPSVGTVSSSLPG